MTSQKPNIVTWSVDHSHLQKLHKHALNGRHCPETVQKRALAYMILYIGPLKLIFSSYFVIAYSSSGWVGHKKEGK